MTSGPSRTGIPLPPVWGLHVLFVFLVLVALVVGVLTSGFAVGLVMGAGIVLLGNGPLRDLGAFLFSVIVTFVCVWFSKTYDYEYLGHHSYFFIAFISLSGFVVGNFLTKQYLEQGHRR